MLNGVGAGPRRPWPAEASAPFHPSGDFQKLKVKNRSFVEKAGKGSRELFFFLICPSIKIDIITWKVQFDAPETDFICRCDENSLTRLQLPLRAGLLLIYVKLARVLNRSHVLMHEA